MGLCAGWLHLEHGSVRGVSSRSAALRRGDHRRTHAGHVGSALIRELRSMRRTIPTLLVSGYVGAELVSRAKEAGADEVLKKPLAMRELAASLDRVLHTTRAQLPKDLGATASADRVAKGRRRAAASASPIRPARRR